MDTIETRAYGYFDFYCRSFIAPGRVSYTLGAPQSHAAANGAGFTIVVGDRPGPEPVQHDVTVCLRDGTLQPDRAEINAAPGDHVLWHAESPDTPRYSVCGAGQGTAWSSSRLDEHSVYVHIFGLAGEYRLVDVASGRVMAELDVVNPPTTSDPCGSAWPVDAAVVALDDVADRPQRAKLVVGQAAAFAVERLRDSGITLVDERLLPQATEPRTGC